MKLVGEAMARFKTNNFPLIGIANFKTLINSDKLVKKEFEYKSLI